jgi:hypothetical protein
MNPTRTDWSKLAAAFAIVTTILGGSGAPASLADDTMQLNVPAPEYTLGRFKYNAPRTDGWRQLANVKDTLSLVYANQPEPDKIETVFGVAIEVHEIPPGTDVKDAAALTALSANQMAEARKEDLVARSPIEAVPTLDNIYTYRLLVHAPVKDQPDAYEVYYVALAPDKSQYVVIQCITKTPDYANELYFTELYGSLATLKYQGGADAAKPADAAAKPADAAAKPADAAAGETAPSGAH